MLASTLTLLPWMAQLLACSDNKVGIYHTPPAVQIVEPASGSSVYQGEDVLFRAIIEAQDSSEYPDMTHLWTAETDIICEEANADSDGIATCTASFVEAGDYSVQVTVTDPRGDRGTSTIDLSVLYNEPPVVQIETPADGEQIRSGELVVISGQVSDTEEEASSLRLSITSSADGVLLSDVTPTTDGSFSEALTLSSGDHLLKVIAEDSVGKTGEDSVTVGINTPPSAAEIAIDPDAVTSGDSFAAVILTEATDPDGDEVSYRYAWYQDGSLYSEGVPAVPSGVTTRGEYWEVVVTPTDGVDDGPSSSMGISIGNSGPSITSVSISPSSPSTGDDLTAVPQGWSDADGDPERYRYAWTHNGSVDSSETTEIFPSDKTTRGDVLMVTVTPYDESEDGAAVASSTVTVQNAVPTTPGIVLEPSAPERDDSLYCTVVTASTDADGDEISYQYSWNLDGVLTANTTNVITADLTSDGETWECLVTPYDGVDLGTPATASVVITDVTAPDAPVLDDLAPYRNEDSVTLSGICEAGCALVYYFSDDTGSWSETGTCNSDGTLSHEVFLTRGSSTEGYATCEDVSGNVSGDSNTVTTEACDPYDSYENSSGYGDAYGAAIDEWSTLSDDGTTTITIEANALDDSDEDWYLISVQDDSSFESSNGWEDFLFEVVLTEGDTLYEVTLFDGSVSLTTPICEGVTEADYYFEDPTWGQGQGCSTTAGSPDITDCPDFSTDYYILVTRRSDADPSCDPYELSITNGMW